MFILHFGLLGYHQAWAGVFKFLTFQVEMLFNPIEIKHMSK